MLAPLKEIRVVDLSRLIPGPYMTLVLASLGAEVIKVEEPGIGDYLRHIPPLVGGKSVLFQALNRGKKSVALDLKSKDGRDKFLQLVQNTDLLVEGFRPGAMNRLKLGYDDLRKLNPALIYCAITGYGQDSPLAGKPGHDINYCALSGLISVNENRPFPVQLADIAGGAMWGCIAVLSALIERNRTGDGMFLDISMTDGVLPFLLPHIAAESSVVDFSGGQPLKMLSGSEMNYTVYETADRRHISLGNIEPQFIECFIQSISPLIGDSQEDLGLRLVEMFKTRTATEWESLFSGKEICFEKLLNLEELSSNTYHRSRGNFIELRSSGEKPMLVPRIPLPVRETDLSPAPELGEHNKEFFK